MNTKGDIAAREARRAVLRTAGFFGLGAMIGSGKASENALPSYAHQQVAQSHSCEYFLNVKDFGAKGDGLADDAPALNAAFDQVRQHSATVGHTPVGARVVLPTGVYAVDSSVNLTNLGTLNTVIEGGGSAIVGRCTGKPILDALGSRWLTLRDVMLAGSAKAPPSIGLQIGISTLHTVADSHILEDVKIFGHFQLACLYNRAAETSAFEHVLLWNDQPNSFCLIQDGTNYFGVTSTFVTSNIPREAQLSFNEDVFINCDFRHGAGGVPVWIGDTARHAFIRCYSATAGGSSFILRCGLNSHTLLDIDCHCETFGLRDVFCISSEHRSVVIEGLSFNEHSSFASRSLFSSDPNIHRVLLTDAKVRVASYRISSCRVFDNPVVWEFDGSYRSAARETWNQPNRFVGTLSLAGSSKQLGNVGMKADTGGALERMSLTNIDEGHLFFDKTLGKLLVWSGSEWLTADGNTP